MGGSFAVLHQSRNHFSLLPTNSSMGQFSHCSNQWWQSLSCSQFHIFPRPGLFFIFLILFYIVYLSNLITNYYVRFNKARQLLLSHYQCHFIATEGTTMLCQFTMGLFFLLLIFSPTGLNWRIFFLFFFFFFFLFFF